MQIKLIRVKRTNPIYQQFRDRHYVPNNGAVGQQIHYLIRVDSEIVGIISGGRRRMRSGVEIPISA